MASLHGYMILSLSLPKQRSFKEPAAHYLYCRRHEPKVPGANDDRTLFVVNVPIDATEAHFRDLFSSLGGGRVELVKLEASRWISKPAIAPAVLSKSKQKKKRKRDEIQENEEAGELPEVWDRQLHRSGGTGLIVFVDKAALDASVKAISKRGKKAVKWEEPSEDKASALGSQRTNSCVYGALELRIDDPSVAGYLTHHRLRYPPPTTLQSVVDAYMTNYKALEAQRARQAKRLRQEPDEEGFITVTRGGRVGPARQEEANAAAERQKKKAANDLKDFYRFQIREERKKAQGELLKKFEEDRRKLEEMKKRRGRFRVSRVAGSRVVAQRC